MGGGDRTTTDRARASRRQRAFALTPAEWQQVKEILDGALERTGPDRAAYLERRCAGNPELRRSIDELIAADDEVASGLGLPIVATPSLLRAIHPLAPGDRIGVYEILEEIGHGGMGVVYLARRADQEFEKRVAIKVARLGMAGDPLLRRFRSERQIIASLDHPNIARLLDGGTTPDGEPYLVMEYVEGRTLPNGARKRNSRPVSASRSSLASARPSPTPTRTASCTGTSSRQTSWSPFKARRSCRNREADRSGAPRGDRRRDRNAPAPLHTRLRQPRAGARRSGDAC